MKILLVSVLACSIFVVSPEQANAAPTQTSTSETIEVQSVESPSAADEKNTLSTQTYIMATTIGALATTGVVIFGALAWWRDTGLQSFSLDDAGFFGEDTYAGGSDKMGHAFSWYFAQHVLTATYMSIGMQRKEAVWMSAALSFFLGNVVEVLDGFTSFGFEWQDSAANVAGLALGILTTYYPDLDKLIGIRTGYINSPLFMEREKDPMKAINDYSGMIFFFDLKFAGIEELSHIPLGALRYATTGITWSTDGYSPKSRPKRRSLGGFVGINVAKVIEDFWFDDQLDPGVVARATRGLTRYWAVPFTSIIAQRDLNNMEDSINFSLANRMQITR